MRDLGHWWWEECCRARCFQDHKHWGWGEAASTFADSGYGKNPHGFSIVEDVSSEIAAQVLLYEGLKGSGSESDGGISVGGGLRMLGVSSCNEVGSNGWIDEVEENVLVVG